MKREERIVIYATPQTKKRWWHAYLDFNVKNNEEAINLLLDIYDILSKRYQTKDLRKLRDRIAGVRMRVVA